jgi:hypothetical protein
MLQRTLPAGFIAPCLPTKTDRLPSGDPWLIAYRDPAVFGEQNSENSKANPINSVRVLAESGKNLSRGVEKNSEEIEKNRV